MLLARQRQDLLDQDLKIPLYNADKGDSYITLEDWRPAEYVDDAYYEVQGLDGWIQSIDLEFANIDGGDPKCDHADWDEYFDTCPCGAHLEAQS